MNELPPIDTAAQRRALRLANRRVYAERVGWPAGVVDECERLELERADWVAEWPEGAGKLSMLNELYAGWHVSWIGPGSSREVPMFCAQWLSFDRLYGGNLARWSLPHGRPWICGETVEELAEQMTILEQRVIAHRIEGARLTQ